MSDEAKSSPVASGAVRAPGPSAAEPTDRQIDRRCFLTRMATLSAAASAGAVFPAGVAGLSGTGLATTGQAGSDRAGVQGGSTAYDPSFQDLPRRQTRSHAHPLAFARRVRPRALADPSELTVAEALTLLRDGSLSAAELLEACLSRIERFDGTYCAFNLVLRDGAREEARQIDRERAAGTGRGLLAGIPIAVKDNYFTAGVPTTANSLIFQDFVPDFDATCVARLRNAGGIVLGKTQMGPLATTRATTPEGDITTVNAWAPDAPSVNPGGSSSGSATAVAARMALSSIGTQTGGSITVPSLAQGLTGLKPTMGRASLYGIIPLTYTRDHPGPLARDAKDAAIMLAAMAGPDPSDPRTRGLPPPADYIEAAEPVERGGRVRLRWPTTIGVPPDYTDASEPRFAEQAAARREMLSTFESLGARLVEVSLPEDWELLTGAFNAVRLPERTEPFLEYLKKDVRLFGVSLSPWINGTLLGGDEYVKGQRAKLLLLRRILEELLGECDIVLQTSHLAFDITGLPLVAFPIGVETAPSGHDLPLGALMGGLPFAEDRLLSLAGAFQAVTEWHLRRPGDPADASEPAGAPGIEAGLGRETGDEDGPGAGGGAGRGRIDAGDVMDISQ